MTATISAPKFTGILHEGTMFEMYEVEYNGMHYSVSVTEEENGTAVFTVYGLEGDILDPNIPVIRQMAEVVNSEVFGKLYLVTMN